MLRRLLGACFGPNEAPESAVVGAGGMAPSGQIAVAPPARRNQRVDEQVLILTGQLLTSCTQGSLLERLRALPQVFEADGVSARLYAVSDDDPDASPTFVLLTDPLLGPDAQPAATACNHQPTAPANVLMLTAVRSQDVVCGTWARGSGRAPQSTPVSHGNTATPCIRVAAVPLFKASSGPNAAAGRVEAVLLLQEHEAPPEEQQQGPGRRSGRAGVLLLREQAELRCLGSMLATALLYDHHPLIGLHMLGSHLSRLHAVPSLEALLRELCRGMAAIVSQRFFLDSTAVPALVPSADAQLGLLFTLPPPGAQHAAQGPASAAATRSANAPARQDHQAGRLRSAELAPRSGLSAAAAAPVADAAAAAPPTEEVRGVAVVEDSAATILPGTPRQQQARSAAAPPVAAVQLLELTDSAATLTTGALRRPPILPATLKARAFELQRTVLHCMLSAPKQQEQQPQQLRSQPECGGDGSAAKAGGTSPTSPLRRVSAVERGIVEDVLRHVQRADSPAGDVCQVLEDAYAPGSSISPKSLAVLLLPLDGAGVLGFYLCMPRVPARLLEACQDACQKWLDFEAVRSCVLGKLAGPLAAELDTFRSGVPGLYAVIHDSDAQQQQVLQDSAEPNAAAAANDADWRAAAGGASATGGSSREAEPTAPPRLLSLQEVEVALRGPRLHNPHPRLGHAQSQRLAYDDGPAARMPGADILRSSPADLAITEGAVSGARSFLTVYGPRPLSSTLRQRMDVLLSSINGTLYEPGGARRPACHYDDLDVLELLEVIGRGAGSVVMRGLVATTHEVAVKLLPVPASAGAVSGVRRPHAAGGGLAHTRAAAARESEREALRNALEIAVQQSVSHPNIVQVYALYRDVREYRDARGKRRLKRAVEVAAAAEEAGPSAPPPPREALLFNALLTEYCELGSLGSALARRTFPRLVHAESGGKGGLPFDFQGVCSTLLEVALALRHLHSLHLVHRDLKPANIFLRASPRDPRGFTAKLGDFGFIHKLSEVDAADGTRFGIVAQTCGTVTHIPPEAYNDTRRVTAAFDVFSFGMVMWELLSNGVRPYSQLQDKLIPHAVWRKCRPTFDPRVPVWYRRLATACWAHEPHQRPTARQLVATLAAQLQQMSADQS